MPQWKSRALANGWLLGLLIAFSSVIVMIAGSATRAQQTDAGAEKLPALIIKYDIPGAEESIPFWVDGPEGSVGPRAIGLVNVNDVKNGEELKIEGLSAGNYEITRYRTLDVEGNDFSVNRFLDRKRFQLRDNELKTIEFTRPGGRNVKGRILGLEGKGIHKVIVNVCGPEIEDYSGFGLVDTILYDAQLCNDDGAFTTEPLLPGSYTIVAEAYLRLTDFQKASTGTIDPRYVGVQKFIVPENGKAPVIPVTLEDAEQVWGDLNVTVTYDGPPPMNKPIEVTKDTSAFGNEVADESLVVGKQGGLANVAVFISNAELKIHPAERKRAKESAELKVVGGQLTPRILPVMVPQEITLTNESPVGVNLNCNGITAAGFNMLVRANDSALAKLESAEKVPVPVGCNIHAWLRAYILPLSHPYAAVTGTDGHTMLMNVPEGEWTVRLWHERVGFLKSPETGEKDFKIKISKGENKLELSVTPEFAVQRNGAIDE